MLVINILHLFTIDHPLNGLFIGFSVPKISR